MSGAALVLALVAGAMSALLTGVTLRHAAGLGLVDMPGARSAHRVPTPRGGGVGFVASFNILLIFLWIQDKVAPSLAIALTGGGLLVAAVGLLDDLGHVAIRWRLAAHLAAVGWLVAWLGGMPGVPVWPFSVEAGWLMNLVAVVSLVWLLNLYNFMDGIDGIAGVETATVCAGGALILWVQGVAQPPLLLMIAAASVGGFLFWNWPPAKIFMGDVGSGFLGFLMGGFALSTVSEIGVWPWLILLGVFLVDATWTLVRRMSRREPWHLPHNTHAYQRAARRLASHGAVTGLVAAINMVWLLPLAFLAARHQAHGASLTVAALLPLLALALWLEKTERAASVAQRDGRGSR